MRNISVLGDNFNRNTAAIAWTFLFIILPILPFSLFIMLSFTEICDCAREVAGLGFGSLLLGINVPEVNETFRFINHCGCRESLVFRANVEFLLLTLLVLYIDLVWIGVRMQKSWEDYVSFILK